jgi:hypothetical protein
VAALAVGNLLIAWAAVRFGKNAQLGWPGRFLLLVAIPYTVNGGYPSLTHVLETVFLAHALAFQAGGRGRWALALTAATLFVKPSMAVVYGGLLCLLIALEARKTARPWRSACVQLLPAVVTAAVLTIGLLALFGPESFAASLSPLVGRANYLRSNYGFFFGIGRLFWMPPAEGVLQYYLTNQVLFWMPATFLLLAGAVWQWLRPMDSQRRWLATTCALGHLAFIVLLFGNRYSWFYYSFMLCFGLATVVDDWPPAWARPTVLGLALLAFLGLRSGLEGARDRWQLTHRSETAGGLWIAPIVEEEWVQVLQETAADRPVLACSQGQIEDLAPRFRSPRWWMLLPGYESPRMVHAARELVDGADCLVTTSLDGRDAEFRVAPELDAAFADFRPVWKGEYFTVWRRSQRRSD